MAEIIETVPFNFDELYNGLKTKFQEKGYDTEEGSNTSQLITAMAYLTSMLNVNTAVNINETILPLATKRNNALQDARAIGYEIQHKQSYTYFLELTLGAGTHTIPRYSKFTVGAKDYWYLGTQLELSDVQAGKKIQITVTEGTLHKYADNPDALSITTTAYTTETGEVLPQYFIDIPFVDVEEDGIEVFVTYYDDYGNLVQHEPWSKSKQFMIDADTTLSKQYIRVDNIDYQTPRIYFTLAGVGEGIRLGSIVDMNILTTSGINGKIDDLMNVGAVSHSLTNLTVSGITLETEGTDEESLQSIKENAPKFYNSANRIVTKSDYESLCNRQTTVKRSMVWGGDDELPKCPGHIWFSFMPSRYDRKFNSNALKTEYILDNWGGLSWDYGIDDSSPAWQAQHATATAFYNARYIQNNEIRSTEYTVGGVLINPGIWDTLDNYKIPTLEFHNRHPIFLDFEYDINVVKYNITDSKQTIHQTIFDTIDGFFTGTNDNINMERFEQEYFHSSLEKRIDTVLTDTTGYTNTVSTKLLLSNKNVSRENYLDVYRDLYLPLAVPYETYIDNNGYLLYSKLPSIDTANFIEYSGETGKDLYTDWSGIAAEISAATKQVDKDVISAPIRVKLEETITTTTAQTYTLSTVRMVPDVVSDLAVSNAVLTFNNIVVKLNNVVLPYNQVGGWMFDPAHPEKITLQAAPTAGQQLKIVANNACGFYHLFNSYKKYIVIQLYVNASGYQDGTNDVLPFDSPKSYLTNLDGFYDYTTDNFYLTTEGFAITTTSQLDSSTGSLVKHITPEVYVNSPIKMDLFRKNRYMNLKYSTANFATLKNVIPRLKRVTFEQGI